MAKQSREVKEALERLTEARNRILRLGIPEGAHDDGFNWTASQVAALDDVHNIAHCIEDLTYLMLSSLSEEHQSLAVTNLDVLMLSMEKLFRVDLFEGEASSELKSQISARLEYARSFRKSKPASFNDAVVEQVFRDHIEANGPWAGKPSTLATKLKPEIDRRALAGGGDSLKPDTITRRLKDLIASTRH